MNILFTSDTHGNTFALDRFVRILEERQYDCGVIAGDILEDGIPYHAIVALLNLPWNGLSEELYGPDEEPEVPPPSILLYDTPEYRLRALCVEEENTRRILHRTRKPIFTELRLCGECNHPSAIGQS